VNFSLLPPHCIIRLPTTLTVLTKTPMLEMTGRHSKARDEYSNILGNTRKHGLKSEMARINCM
jgi:hypothetical protein